MAMQSKRNSYKALIWQAESEATGKRVTVMAESLEQARLKLEEKYGHGSIFDLHDETNTSRASDMPSANSGP
jgi:hypothetical protein